MLGYERAGENGLVPDKENCIVYQSLKPLIDPETGELRLPENIPMGGFSKEKLTKMFHSIGKPYIEGAFMNKYNGKYYLQYACPATQFNTYADAVYISDSPLGPFSLQNSNPYSSKPGGFMHAAGQGSTIQDENGNYWHASVIVIIFPIICMLLCIVLNTVNDKSICDSYTNYSGCRSWILELFL